MLPDLPPLDVSAPWSYVLAFGTIGLVILCIAGPDHGLGWYFEQFVQKRKVTHKKRRKTDWVSVLWWGVIFTGILILSMSASLWFGCEAVQAPEIVSTGLCQR